MISNNSEQFCNQFKIASVVFAALWMLAVRSEDINLCTKCRCIKRNLIQPFYTANCSHLALSHTFPNLTLWPEYAQAPDTRLAANFDWNNIRNLHKFPRLLGIADSFRGRYSPEHYEPLGIVVLNLGYNNIHSLGPHAFEHLPNLTALRLNNNPLTLLDDTTLLALESPISLQKLNLNDNPISELQEDSFRGLVTLREINISAMPHLSRIGPSTFSHLKNLEVLHCSYNPHLADVDAEAFKYGDNKTPLREDNPWRCDCGVLWLVNKLVPFLENSTPDQVMQLHCSEPLNLSGMSILSFKNPDNQAKLCNNQHKPSTTKSSYNALNAALLAVGIILLISTAVSVTTLFILRRWTNRTINFKLFVSPNIRYVRTRFET
ncbi:hypothetical protein C0J52_22953 [Blattella germanica]|nr:hypothetical protein C0J52_22953 [Blattella germanica]